MPATIQQLKAACPGASSGFILGQLEAGAEVSQAVAAYSAGANSGGDWEAAVSAQMKARPGITKLDAALIVDQQQPGLREAYVANHNRQKGRSAAAA